MFKASGLWEARNCLQTWSLLLCCGEVGWDDHIFALVYTWSVLSNCDVGTHGRCYAMVAVGWGGVWWAHSVLVHTWSMLRSCDVGVTCTHGRCYTMLGAGAGCATWWAAGCWCVWLFVQFGFGGIHLLIVNECKSSSIGLFPSENAIFSVRWSVLQVRFGWFVILWWYIEVLASHRSIISALLFWFFGRWFAKKPCGFHALEGCFWLPPVLEGYESEPIVRWNALQSGLGQMCSRLTLIRGLLLVHCFNSI